MAEDFKITITTQGDTKGAEAVAGALQKVGKSAGETAKGSRQLGDDLITLGSRQNATKDVIEGLNASLQGNKDSFFGLAKAVKNLWEIMTVSTPVGRGIQLFLIGATGAATFGKDLLGLGRAAKEAAVPMKDFVEALEKAAAKRTIQLTKDMQELADVTKDAADEFNRVISEADKIDSLKADIEKAKINADDSLSPDEKRRRIAVEDLNLNKRRREREDQTLGNDYGIASRRSEVLNRLRDGIGEEIETSKATIAAPAIARSQRRALELELQNLQRRVGGTSEEAMARGTRMAEITNTLEKTKGAGDVSPEWMDAQKKRLATLEGDYEKLSREADGAASALSKLKEQVPQLASDGRTAERRPAVYEMRSLEDNLVRINGGLSVPTGQNRPRPAPQGQSQALIIDTASLKAMSEKGGIPASAVVELFRQVMDERDAKIVEKLRERIRSLQ